jgi:hypothetical protein
MHAISPHLHAMCLYTLESATFDLLSFMFAYSELESIITHALLYYRDHHSTLLWKLLKAVMNQGGNVVVVCIVLVVALN